MKLVNKSKDLYLFCIIRCFLYFKKGLLGKINIEVIVRILKLFVFDDEFLKYIIIYILL